MAPRTPTPELDAGFSVPNATPTPWADVHAALRDAELFWISTVRPEGRPHVTPLPAVWHDMALYLCTGPQEQKAVNLRANPHCVLTTGTNHWKSGLDVVVEGRATRTCLPSISGWASLDVLDLGIPSSRAHIPSPAGAA